jgi:hypothetical protein
MAMPLGQPPAPGRIRIVDRTRIPSPEPNRIGRFDEAITFMDDRMRTYVLMIPAEDLEGKSEEEQAKIIAERAKAMVGQRSSWTGRELGIA